MKEVKQQTISALKSKYEQVAAVLFKKLMDNPPKVPPCRYRPDDDMEPMFHCNCNCSDDGPLGKPFHD